MTDWEDLISKATIDAYKVVMAQREEILAAFIAKYGVEPQDIVQKEFIKSPTERYWFIETKENALNETLTNVAKDRDNWQKLAEEHYKNAQFWFDQADALKKQLHEVKLKLAELISHGH